jgi:hypothetical protein
MHPPPLHHPNSVPWPWRCIHCSIASAYTHFLLVGRPSCTDCEHPTRSFVHEAVLMAPLHVSFPPSILSLLCTVCTLWAGTLTPLHHSHEHRQSVNGSAFSRRDSQVPRTQLAIVRDRWVPSPFGFAGHDVTQTVRGKDVVCLEGSWQNVRMTSLRRAHELHSHYSARMHTRSRVAIPDRACPT